MVSFHNNYEYIISLENLTLAWQEFLKGKKKRKDVAVFGLNVFENIYHLHHELHKQVYVHGGYHAFAVHDPKPRSIHKASVRDRMVHRALYRTLYPLYDRTFIYHSYSCRINKGTHKALDAFTAMSRRASRNHTTTLWVLKCDIKKFFASIHHEVLLNILKKKIADPATFLLLEHIIKSFHTEGRPGVGLPLGNLTSQLLVNVYMNEFDQWVKHTLRARYYIRYADDFVFMDTNKEQLERYIPHIAEFLENNLCLHLHPDKVFIKTVASGIDFLGWIHFPFHRVLRTATKRRMFRNFKKGFTSEKYASYSGMLSHGNGYTLQKELDILKHSYRVPAEL